MARINNTEPIVLKVPTGRQTMSISDSWYWARTISNNNRAIELVRLALYFGDMKRALQAAKYDKKLIVSPADRTITRPGKEVVPAAVSNQSASAQLILPEVKLNIPQNPCGCW